MNFLLHFSQTFELKSTSWWIRMWAWRFLRVLQWPLSHCGHLNLLAWLWVIFMCLPRPLFVRRTFEQNWGEGKSWKGRGWQCHQLTLQEYDLTGNGKSSVDDSSSLFMSSVIIGSSSRASKITFSWFLGIIWWRRWEMSRTWRSIPSWQLHNEIFELSFAAL